MRARLLVSFYVLFSISTAHAQWFPNGSPVCTAANDQFLIAACEDFMGGALVAWADYRSGGGIYAQHIAPNGHALWTANGVPICTAFSEEFLPSIIPRGAGGAYIAWVDARFGNDDVYVQLVDGTGAALWTANGVAVCTAPGGQFSPKMTVSLDGILTVVWDDGRNLMTNGIDIYANRVSSSGTVLDGPNGFPVYAGAAAQRVGSFVRCDSEGTSFVVWTDERNLATTGSDIYGAYITSLGNVLGTTICTAPDHQRSPSAVTDFSATIIAWSDERPGYVFAQRLDSNGIATWGLNGRAAGIGVGGFFNHKPALLSDGAHGAIVAWGRFEGNDVDLFAQRLNSSGTRLWPGDVPVCNDVGITQTLSFSSIATDNADEIGGGAVIAWTDNRPGGQLDDVYAQRLSPSGVPQWTPNGVAVCVAEWQQSGLATVPDMMGGAIVVWADQRDEEFTSNVYANRVFGDGTPSSVSGAPAAARLEPNFPNPFNPGTTIPFSLTVAAHVTLCVYDVHGAHVATLLDEHRDAGGYVARWDGRTEKGEIAPTGVYFVRLGAAGSTLTQKLVLLK